MGSSVTLSDESSIHEPASLDEALEYAIVALESNQPLDREALLAKFPRWAADLNQFIDNWLAMEHKTGRLVIAAAPSAPKQLPAALTGKIVGDYQLLELISSGGMGVVYRARQLSLGRIVALKMVWNALRDKTRFRIEAEAAASLHHANIISIHEVGEFEGQPFLSMQFIEGGNLQDRLQSGPLSNEAAAALLQTIALAVHYAHQRGILHRDLKPANVLLDLDGKPYVTDFGLAKQMGNSVELTRSGAIIGTPGYMAPEQAMGQVKSITVAADVYGLGAILYAMLTGEAPFKADSELITLRRVIEDLPVSPRTKRAEVDRNIENICLKCLEKTPTSRYASAKHLADDLARYSRGEPVIARPVSFMEQRWRWCLRNPVVAGLLSFALLLLIAVALMSLGIAWREYVARLASEDSRLREVAMRESVELARMKAEQQSRAAQQALADLYTTNGLWAARTDLHGEALLWFAHAATLDRLDASQATTAKMRCSSWASASLRPIAAWKLPSNIQIDTFQSDWRAWALSPDHTELMVKSGTHFGVWRFETGDFWQPSDPEFEVRAATWNQNGTLLAMGNHDGEVRILDSSTLSIISTIHLSHPIEHLAFSHSGDRLAVANGNRLEVLDTQDVQERVFEWKHDADFVFARFSNDDSQLAAVSSDGSANVYSLSNDTGPPTFKVKSFLSPPGSYNQEMYPEFSDDGKKLYVRSESRRAQIYDLTTGRQLGPSITTGQTYSLALSPSKRHIIAGGDNYARIQTIQWSSDVPTFVRHDNRLAHQDAVNTIVFGGKDLVATGGLDQVVHLWNVGEPISPEGLLNERAIPLATLPHMDRVVGMLFPPNGQRLVTVQRDGLIRVWSIPDMEAPGYRINVAKGGSAVKIVDANHWLVAGATNGKGNMQNASLRRVTNGQVVAETLLNGFGERGHLLDTAITKDLATLISVHSNPRRSSLTVVTDDATSGSIQVWNRPFGRPRRPGLPLSAEPRAVAIHPEEKVAAVLTVKKEILLVDIVESAIIQTLSPEGMARPTNAEASKVPASLFNGQLQFSRDGTLLLVWGLGKGFDAWDIRSRQPAFSNAFASSWTIDQLALSPDGQLIALAIREPNQLVLVESKTGTIQRVIEHSSAIESVDFSSSGNEILTGCADGRIRVFEVLTGNRKLADIVHSKRVLDALFSPSGHRLASLTSDFRVHVWEVPDGQLVFKPMSVPVGTKELRFSQDSNFILTMGSGTELQVLDLASYEGYDALTLEQAILLGELLCAKSIDASGIVNMTSNEWFERWRKFQRDR